MNLSDVLTIMARHVLKETQDAVLLMPHLPQLVERLERHRVLV
jgi:hypothetical protein